jgi:rhodanese-related sulfurtransferase
MVAFLGEVKRRFWWMPFGRVAEISPAELHARLCGPAPPQVVDVRTTLEWRRSHIGGAVHVPITELRKRLPDLSLDAGRPVVAICLTAHRSIPAVRLLQSRGFRDAMQLAGGMTAWWRAGLPTARNRGAQTGGGPPWR